MQKHCIFEKFQNSESEIGSSAPPNLVYIARDHSQYVVRGAGDASAHSRDIWRTLRVAERSIRTVLPCGFSVSSWIFVVYDKPLITGIPMLFKAKHCIFEKFQNSESEIGSSATSNLVYIARDHSQYVMRGAGEASAHSHDIWRTLRVAERSIRTIVPCGFSVSSWIFVVYGKQRITGIPMKINAKTLYFWKLSK